MTGAGDEVDAYLAAVPSPQRETIVALRATLRRILPHAEEKMKYGMPAFVVDGQGIAGYAAFKAHCGYFPMSSDVLTAAAAEIGDRPTSKGGLRFGVDERLPVGLVRRLVKLRLDELAAVENGTRREFHADGTLKAIGPMKDGRLHGTWKWYRRDGTLMRTGRFSHGDKTGTWNTWDADGNAVTTTRY